MVVALWFIMTSTTLASFIGMLLTDGGISRDKRKKSTYRFFFTNKCEGLIHVFRQSAQELFGDINFVTHKCTRAQHTHFTASKHALKLLSLTKSFRTKACRTHPVCPKFSGADAVCLECTAETGFPPTRIPDFVKTGALDVKSAFFRAAFSCDGTCVFVKKKEYSARRVKLACKHPNLLQEYHDLLMSIGINNRLGKEELVIFGRENLKKFGDTIGFLEESKMSRGLHVGQYKNTVLKHMLLG